ncbi:hypothetical protein ACPFUU_003571 [Vibrio cholerae]|uniref:hypothetical protein n=1 Tax=Vibrio TaxID=662 RepID=UPI0005EE7848|nr:hypothetical protein [Vibrio rotiferianus]MBE3713998.1 hypothetical protein [Vibrio parahaemolyticus]HCG9204695.1 hypothetical protein [Vibrio parahaemolyticus]
MKNRKLVLYVDRNEVARREFIDRHKNTRLDIKGFSDTHELQEWIDANKFPDLVIVDLYREKGELSDEHYKSDVVAFEKRLKKFAQDRETLADEIEDVYEYVGFSDFEDILKYYPERPFPIAIGSRYGRRLVSSKDFSIHQEKKLQWVWKLSDRSDLGESKRPSKKNILEEEDSALRIINGFAIKNNEDGIKDLKLKHAESSLENISAECVELKAICKESENKVLRLKERYSRQLILNLVLTLVIICLSLTITVISYRVFENLEFLNVLSATSSIITLISFISGVVVVMLVKATRKFLSNRKKPHLLLGDNI